MEFNLTDLTDRILRIQAYYGLSDRDFAQKIGIAASTIGSWRKGSRSPRIETLIEISNQFDVPINQLLFGRSDAQKFVEKQNADNDNEKHLLETFRKLPTPMQSMTLVYADRLYDSIK